MDKYQKYAEYKDSGVEWLGKIPKDWGVIKLKYIVDLISEKSQDNSQKYVGMENITSKNGNYIHTEEVIPEGISNLFKEDDVLFGKLRPYLAKSWLASFSGICSSELLVLRAKDVCPKYLQYYTLTDEFINQVDSSTYGSKMPRASWEFISLLPVPECSIDLSVKIANFLDYETAKIDRLIAKQEQLIALLHEKRQAVISHAVTKGLNPDATMKDSGVEWLGQVPEHWQIPSSKYLLEIPITDGPHETPQFVDDGVPFISAEAIHNGKINFDKQRGYITPELNEIYSKKYSPKIEDIYMVKSGATTGKVAMVETEDTFNIWSPLAVFRCNQVIMLPKFLLAVFNSNHFYDALVLNWNYGTQQNIGMGVLSNIEIPCPPINEQEEIIKYIDNELEVFKKLENKINHAVQLMQERRTALISAAVTGKIDVRDWQAPPDATVS